MGINKSQIQDNFEKIEQDTTNFINNYSCNCKMKTNFPNGKVYCKHLIFDKNKKFRKRILKLIIGINK